VRIAILDWNVEGRYRSDVRRVLDGRRDIPASLQEQG